jgi:hypothetical protein
MNQTFYYQNPSGGWTPFGWNNNTGNGTVSNSSSGWVTEYATLYHWASNVSDGHGGYSNNSYLFWSFNYQVAFSGDTPTNKSIDVSINTDNLSVFLEIVVCPYNYNISILFINETGIKLYQNYTNESAAFGTYYLNISSMTPLNYSYNYTWFVNTTDYNGSNYFLGNYYWFETENLTCPDGCELLALINALEARIIILENSLGIGDDTLVIDTNQFLIIMFVIVFSIFAYIAETANKKDHARRGLNFFIAGIIGLFGGVALAAIFNWWFSFAFLTMTGFYWIRAAVNLGKLRNMA